jgi:hypothetical protein
MDQKILEGIFNIFFTVDDQIGTYLGRSYTGAQRIKVLVSHRAIESVLALS